ncbi:uncharacterized protein LOC143275474 [Babylonia areolata]|uniref:uncharacterized protein LOC143275474 n=1 Tax=Babylonia areolata TaxID=304850 RepID=UPI003FD480F7
MPPPPEPMPPRQAVVQRVVVMPPQFEEEEDADESGLPTEAAFRPLTLSEISRHVEENLEERERREEMGTHIPSPTMTDATSTAIGDMPLSPVVPHTSVENY